MHITSEYPAPLSPRVNLRIQGGGNNRPEWVATFAPESVATIVPEWVATFARNPHFPFFFFKQVFIFYQINHQHSFFFKREMIVLENPVRKETLSFAPFRIV